MIGGALANCSGTIENTTLTPPASVAGLEYFMRAIAGAAASPSGLPLVCFQDPSRETVSFARARTGGAALLVTRVR